MVDESHAPIWQSEEVAHFRDSARRFISCEFRPLLSKWRSQQHPDLDAWQKAGSIGLLLPDIPTEYGGGGGSFAHECTVIEELARAQVPFGAGVQSIVAHYILSYGSEAQKRSWLPRMARGELIASIAMTEPSAGSDLSAIQTTAQRSGASYVISGNKTFITNGQNAGLVCLAAKTNRNAPAIRAISMIMIETRDLAGYSVGQPLEKIGMNAQDTCELFFNDVRVSADNLLGGVEGRGFTQMMQQLPYERLSIAVMAVVMAEEAVSMTARYARERMIAGKPLFDLQNTRFKLAECSAAARVCRAYVDDCVRRHVAGCLDDASAATAKYWATERLGRIVDECLQLHGGYGYMTEYPIAQLWLDSRVQRIYAGTNEIMKEVIAHSL
jgi:acyl-CoA dehydrogenase